MDRYSKNRELNDKLLALFEKQQAGFNSSSIPPLNNYRAEGLARFKEIGIPNKTVEEYRYSDMTEPYKTNYVTLPSYIELKADLHKIFKCETPELNAHTALSINGWFYRENKQIGALPEGVVICSMITAYNEHREILEKHIGTAVADCNDPMVAINKMFAADGFFVYIPKGVVMENPIQLVHLTGSNKATSATQRNLIIAESCSEAKILLCDHSLAENSTLSNRLTEIAVGSSANVELYSIGNQNNSASTVTQSM